MSRDRRLKKPCKIDNSCGQTGVSDVGVPRHPDRFDPGLARAVERPFARDFPADRRELSGDRRAGRLAQHLAPAADVAVAGLGPQRDVRPRTARPDLCAAYLGRPAADRTRPALLRRCADADRRHQRQRQARDRSAGGGPRPVLRECADTGFRTAVRPDARRRRGADRQAECGAQAYRIRPPRARARAGRAGRRRRAGRKPHPAGTGGTADFGADRGHEFSQLPHSRQDHRRIAARTGRCAGGRPRRTRSTHPEDRGRRALRAGRAANSTSAS